MEDDVTYEVELIKHGEFRDFTQVSASKCGYRWNAMVHPVVVGQNPDAIEEAKARALAELDKFLSTMRPPNDEASLILKQQAQLRAAAMESSALRRELELKRRSEDEDTRLLLDVAIILDELATNAHLDAVDGQPHPEDCLGCLLASVAQRCRRQP